MDFDLFDTTELLPMVESLFVPGNFLLKAFFPEVLEFDTRIVHFDRVLPDRRLAPFVSPLARQDPAAEGLPDRDADPGLYQAEEPGHGAPRS
jgi:hypothetical protein